MLAHLINKKNQITYHLSRPGAGGWGCGRGFRETRLQPIDRPHPGVILTFHLSCHLSLILSPFSSFITAITLINHILSLITYPNTISLIRSLVTNHLSQNPLFWPPLSSHFSLITFHLSFIWPPFHTVGHLPPRGSRPHLCCDGHCKCSIYSMQWCKCWYCWLFVWKNPPIGAWRCTQPLNFPSNF